MTRTVGMLPLLVGVMILAGVAGCVERTVRVETDPPGALVIINDEEVGVSPAKFTFLWYGDYDVIVRKQGYQTLKTHQRVDAPWYEWPGIDLVSECLVPGTIKDTHVWGPFKLEPTDAPAATDVVSRATELRERTLYSGD